MALSKEAQHARMLETPMSQLILSLSIPTVLSQLISTIYNTADTYFVAKIGTSAAAAVGVVFSLMSLIQAVGYGTGMGAGSLISRHLGAKEYEEADKIASSALAAAACFGFVLMILSYLTMGPLMRLLGSTETMLPYSRAYAGYILLGAPIMCPTFVLNNLLRAEGETKLAMYGLCTGGILNMILDPVFIFGLGMGISGAALATILSQMVSFGILLSQFLRGKTILKPHPGKISRLAADYIRIYRTGLPTICRQGLGSLSSALLNIQAAAFGDATVAAVTIANKIYMLVRNIILGIGQGFQPVVGYNYGARNNRRVREAFNFATCLGTGICLVACAALGFFAADVIGWFRADDPEVIAIGTFAIRCCAAVMPFMAYSTYVNQLYQCLGFSTPATFLACCRQGICFVPLVFLLPLLCQAQGVAMTQPGADLLTFFIALPFQITFYRRHLPVETQN